MKSVQNYGLHWDGSVAWLLQGRGKGSNFVGLRGECPFESTHSMCNHLVPVAAPIPDRHHWSEFSRIMRDPLVKAMLPVPPSNGQKAIFIEDRKNELEIFLACLSRLSSPILPVVKSTLTLKVKDLAHELTSSNIQPLILIQSTSDSQELIDLVVAFAPRSPRTVIIVGDAEVTDGAVVQTIESDILSLIPLQILIPLPLESIGATVLRRYSRNEDIYAPMEQREDRRARQIGERKKT